MSLITNFLKKISPFYSISDQDLFSRLRRTKDVSPYLIPYQIEFDGTAYWFDTLDLFNEPNFHFKTAKDYFKFKEIIDTNKRLLFSNIEISKEMSKEEIEKIFTDAQDTLIRIRLMLDSKKELSIQYFPHLQIPIKNYVILDFIDLYQKVGSQFISDIIFPIAKVGRTCGLNLSVVGDQKTISPNILSSISNTVESSGQSLYINSKVFDNVQKKYEFLVTELVNKSATYLSSGNFFFYDDSQFKNQAMIGEGSFMFYDHPQYKPPQTHEEKVKELKLELNWGTAGKYFYIYGIKLIDDRLIVHDIHTNRLGYIEADKFGKLSRARVSIKDRR